jgi:hypothetical protein
MSDTVFLVVKSAFVLSGDIVTEGMLVEVTNAEARDLLSRDKARVATEEDQPDVAPAEEPTEPTGKAKK